MTAKTVQALHPALRDDIADLVTRRPREEILDAIRDYQAGLFDKVGAS